MLSLVALDIETTGLDSQTDSIIEIGAIRFTARRVEGEWSTLINPWAPHSPFHYSIDRYHRSDGDRFTSHPCSFGRFKRFCW